MIRFIKNNKNKLISVYIVFLSAYTSYVIIISIGSVAARNTKGIQRLEKNVNVATKGFYGLNNDISTVITKYAAKHGIERSILSCVLKIESSYKLNAVSSTDDWGIGQINKKAWPEYDHNKLLVDLEYSVESSAKVLAYYRWLKAKDEPTRWVCRYNVGPGALNGSERALLRNSQCRAYLDRFLPCYASSPFVGL